MFLLIAIGNALPNFREENNQNLYNQGNWLELWQLCSLRSTSCSAEA